MKRLDLLKCLSHTSWGSDQTAMLRIYRAIVRSKMDYACFIYGTAKENVLKLLDPVHNAAIRLCTGAYCSSPVESLYADSGEHSLQKRRLQVLMQYYARTLQLESSAAYPYVDIETILPPEVRPGHVKKTLNEEILAAVSTLTLTISTLPFLFPGIPVWQAGQVICREYSYPKKENCSPQHNENSFQGSSG